MSVSRAFQAPMLLRGYRVHQYSVQLCDGPLALLGPHDPDTLLDDPRTTQRFYAENEYIPYWAHLWPSAIMLADYIQRVHPCRTGNALELGCGLGLAGIAAARRGWLTTLTDYDADALAFAQASAAANGISLAGAHCLDWTQPGACKPVDLLLGADILFEARWVSPVARIIRSMITTGTAIICDPNRRTSEGFAAALRELDLSVECVPVSTNQPDNHLVRGTIFVITSPDSATAP